MINKASTECYDCISVTFNFRIESDYVTNTAIWHNKVRRDSVISFHCFGDNVIHYKYCTTVITITKIQHGQVLLKTKIN